MFIQRNVNGKLTGAFASQQYSDDGELLSLEWIADDDAELMEFLAPPLVPSSVTPRQARLALIAAGLLDQVNAAANAGGAVAQVNWFFADSIDRDNEFLASTATALGLTDAQVDALFISAAKIV